MQEIRSLSEKPEHTGKTRGLAHYVLPLVVTLFTAALFASCENSETGSSKKSSIPTTDITGLSSDSGEVQVEVRVPEGYHAYLDSGDEGNLIPIKFYWHDLTNKGVLANEPSIIEEPEGSRDEEFKAKVLRGRGIYRFQTGNNQSLSGEVIRVQTQICDDSKGICYRPNTVEVPIK